MKVSRQSSESICPLPFLHTYITANGSAVACCESQEQVLGESTTDFSKIWNGETYKKLRQDLLAGEKPKTCQKCWNNEALALPSNREEMWRDYESGLFGQQSLVVENDFSVSKRPWSIEMKCSNLCNLKCRMCHPESSHRVNEDQEIISRYRKNIPWSSTVLSSKKTVTGLIELGKDFFNNLSVVQYSGGEPLISDEQLDFTQTILKYNPENIHLRYATNLTHLNYKNVSYPEIWKNFKQINIKVSIDGLNDVYDYIRVGSQFEKVVNNIKRLQDFNLPNLSLSIGFTTQAYNVYQMPEFLDYFEKVVPRKAITTHLLHAPKMMMIDVFPENIREKIIRKFEQERPELSQIITLLRESPRIEKYWQSLCNYTKEMEAKYSIDSGFEYLLQKYLADF